MSSPTDALVSCLKKQC